MPNPGEIEPYAFENYRRWMAELAPPWLREERGRALLEGLGEAVRKRLLEAGFPPEYATFPSPEELARGLGLLQGKGGVVRVGVVAAKELWTTERPLLSFQLLGGPPGPEVPVPTR